MPRKTNLDTLTESWGLDDHNWASVVTDTLDDLLPGGIDAMQNGLNLGLNKAELIRRLSEHGVRRADKTAELVLRVKDEYQKIVGIRPNFRSWLTSSTNATGSKLKTVIQDRTWKFW